MRNDVVVVIIINLKIHPLPSIFQLLVRSASVGIHLPARTFSEAVEVFRVGKQLVWGRSGKNNWALTASHDLGNF